MSRLGRALVPLTLLAPAALPAACAQSIDVWGPTGEPPADAPFERPDVDIDVPRGEDPSGEGEGEGEGDDAGLQLDVFAPYATRVAVAGTFNGWSPDADLLERGDDGVWRGMVVGARPGDNYRLVIDGPAGRLWKNDPRAEQVTSSVGDSVVGPRAAFHDDAFTAVPWNEAVIYEMHVGTFNDEPGGHVGTFDDAIQKLDDLAELGVTHLEVMPVAEFAGDVSWGYNPAHLFAVESAYGGPAALDRFVDEAHARGLAVIVDVVYNHLGPSDLDLWRFDGWSQGDGGGAYFYGDDRAQTPWGHTRPDYGRSQVRQLLRDNARSWVERHHVDGLRLDSTSNVRARMFGFGDIPDGWKLLQELNDDMDAQPRFTPIIAEDLAGIAAITSPTSLGGAGFDAQWDPHFVHPVRAALTAASDDARSMAALKNAIGSRVDHDAFGRVIYTESHDEVANGRARVPEEITPGDAASFFAVRRSALGVVLVMTSPGVPMMFMGQEMLEDGWFSDTDPLDWSKRETHAGFRSLVRDLVAVRRNLDGTTRGLTGSNVAVQHVNEGGKVIGFHRWHSGGAGDDVVVVASFANRSFGAYSVGFPHCGAWTVRVASKDASAVGDGPGDVVQANGPPRDGMPCSATLELAAYQATVLSQEP